MDDQIWNPPPQPTEAAVPPPDASGTAFRGRTPGRSSAIRAGAIVGSTLVVAVGAAVVLGASPAASSGVGAGPSAAASGAPGADRGIGRGFRGGFGLGPSALGPWALGGPGKAGVPGVGAGPLGERLGGRFGDVEVAAVSGTSISLKTDDGWTRTITVTSDTKVTRGGQPATAADVKVGDKVRFAERRNSDGSFTITALGVVLPRTAGTVTAVDSDTITITRRDGTTQTIRTTGSTTYHLGGANGSRSDIKVGSIIAAVGERGSDGSLSASSIDVFLPRVAGAVTSVAADSVTIRRPDGTSVTIHVGSNTTIRVGGVGSAKLSDVKVGMVLRAEGTQRSDGSLDATAMRAGEVGKLRPNSKAPKAAPGASTSPTTGNG